jgi:hypothetical protein
VIAAEEDIEVEYVRKPTDSEGGPHPGDHERLAKGLRSYPIALP